jgi:hypothetical protein
MHLINKPDTEYTGQVSVSVLFHRLYFKEGKYNLSLFFDTYHSILVFYTTIPNIKLKTKILTCTCNMNFDIK